jgi:hypothetical protein
LCISGSVYLCCRSTSAQHDRNIQLDSAQQSSIELYSAHQTSFAATWRLLAPAGGDVIAQNVAHPAAMFRLQATAGIRGGGSAGTPGVIKAHALLVPKGKDISAGTSPQGGAVQTDAALDVSLATDGVAKALDTTLDRHRVAGRGPVWLMWPLADGRPSRYVTAADCGGTVSKWQAFDLLPAAGVALTASNL